MDGQQLTAKHIVPPQEWDSNIFGCVWRGLGGYKQQQQQLDFAVYDQSQCYLCAYLF